MSYIVDNKPSSAAYLNSSIFSDVTPCGQVKLRTGHLHVESRKERRQVANRAHWCVLYSTGFFLGLLFGCGSKRHVPHRSALHYILTIAVSVQVLPQVAWFLARMIFDPEDWGDMFLRNVGSHTDHTALYLRRWQHSPCLQFINTDSPWNFSWFLHVLSL
jgi:hypothetical protein